MRIDTDIGFVIRDPERMVKIYDQNGKIMSGYGGLYWQLREKISQIAPPDAIFGHQEKTGITYLKKRKEW